MTQSLVRAEILRRRRDVGRVKRTGTRTGTRFLSLRSAPRTEADAGGSPSVDVVPSRRVAFLLPHGVGNAVARNRLKRRLREIYRRSKDWFPEGRDYLILPAASAGRLSFGALREQVHLAIQPKSEGRRQNTGQSGEPRIDTDEHR